MKKPSFTFLIFCASLAFSATYATAESITYTYTGAGFRTGTNFTYIDPNGFLSFDTGQLVPTTATHIFFKGKDLGQIVSFDFFSYYLYDLYTTSTYVEDTNEGFNLNVLGTQFSNYASLSIAPTSGVPEPSSLVLLATGALGLAASLRRRLFS